MRRLVLLAALLVCTRVSPGQTGASTEVFDRANAEFAAGAYDAALDGYHAILDDGQVSGALYHNLGSTYYRIDEVGMAVLYYEKARALLGDDPQLVHNLSIIQARINSPFSVLPTPFWQVWWNRAFVRRGAVVFLIIGGVLYLMAAILYCQHAWTHTSSGWHRRLRAAALGMGSCTLLVAAAVSVSQIAGSRGVIVVPSTTLERTVERSVHVPEGIVVDVMHAGEERAEIRLPNGVRGTVPASAVATI